MEGEWFSAFVLLCICKCIWRLQESNDRDLAQFCLQLLYILSDIFCSTHKSENMGMIVSISKVFHCGRLSFVGGFGFHFLRTRFMIFLCDLSLFSLLNVGNWNVFYKNNHSHLTVMFVS